MFCDVLKCFIRNYKLLLRCGFQTDRPQVRYYCEKLKFLPVPSFEEISNLTLSICLSSALATKPASVDFKPEFISWQEISLFPILTFKKCFEQGGKIFK